MGGLGRRDLGRLCRRLVLGRMVSQCYYEGHV